MKKYNSKIIIACDFSNKKELFDFLLQFKSEKLFLKLGMQLLYSEGFSFINQLKTLGHNIFIDLKINDIPNTSKNAILALKKYQPDFISVHGFNSKEALCEIKKAASLINCKVFAVSLLTSIIQSDLDSLKIYKSLNNQIEDTIKICKKANIDGIISSPNEAKITKKYNLIALTPGIRMENENLNDQKRVNNPLAAISLGADFLVIGRSITKAKNPFLKYQQIKNLIK